MKMALLVTERLWVSEDEEVTGVSSVDLGL